MAERTTIARPYAEAVFMLACNTSSLQRWGDVLAFYAIAVADENLAYALGDPRMSGEQLDELLASLMDDISGQEQALLKMLRENGKLQLLPEVFEWNRARRVRKWAVVVKVVQRIHIQILIPGRATASLVLDDGERGERAVLRNVVPPPHVEHGDMNHLR